MTTRIDAKFAALKRDGRAAFVTYVMCGDPDIATSLEIMKALPKAGADIIELGLAFTDPMADGPAIQAAGLRALKAGATLKKTLQVVRDFRKDDAATQAPTVSQTSEGAVTIDPASEAARLQALTGGRQAITIQPRRSGGFKLPGL